jgi:IMP dehydrogenase
VDLSTPLVRHRVGEPAPLRIAVPMVSAVMEAVSSPRLAIALAQCGGLAFIHPNQTIDKQADMVRAVKRHKAGFRHSDINVKPSASLGEVTALLAASERDVAVVTDDRGRGQPPIVPPEQRRSPAPRPPHRRRQLTPSQQGGSR